MADAGSDQTAVDHGGGEASPPSRPQRWWTRWVRWPRRIPPAPDPPARPTGLLDRVTAAAERRTTPLRALTALVVLTVFTGGVLAVISLQPSGLDPQWVSAEETTGPPAPRPAPEREPPRPVAAGPLRSPPPQSSLADPAGDFTEWAILDTGTGEITGSDGMAETSTTASMIKVWLVADYLRRTADAGNEPSQARLDQLTLIVRDSDNGFAQALFEELGGTASIKRLLQICQLTDSRAYPNRWSNTQLSPRDTARMGACIADGTAAGPDWTDWLLEEMRQVRGVGDFGIRHALPADQRSSVAIKNGWVIRDAQDAWHVNCLAIGDGWTMGVMTRYPARLGYEHGAELCRSFAAENLL